MPREYKLFGSLCACLYLELLGGGVYAFSVYSVYLKEHFGLTQGQVQLIGTSGNLGAWLLLPAGCFFDKFGPRPGIGFGALLVFTGYMILWGAMTGILVPSLPVLCLGAFTAQHGCSYWDGTAVPMASRNFAGDRGLVVGLLKGFFGISSSVLTVVYQSFFRPSISSFILSLTLVLPAGALVTMLGAHVTEKNPSELMLSAQEKARVATLGYGLLAALVVFVSTGSLYQRERGSRAVGVVLLGLLAGFLALLFPLAMPRWIVDMFTGAAGRVDREEEGGEEEEQGALLAGHVGAPRKERTKCGLFGSSMFVLRHRKFWIIFVVCVTVMGTGITLINNVGNVVVSLGKEGVGFYVIMISVGSTLGRAGAGFLRLGMVWPPIIAAAAQLILSSSSWYALSFGCFFTGVGFGASFTLQPCCLAEVFGTKDFGKILGLSMFAPSVGSILLSVVMATFIYDIHIPPGGEVCMGPSCFRFTFLILAALNIACALLVKVFLYKK